MSVLFTAIKCFVLAIFYGLLPMALGFGIGWVMKGEQMDKHEYLKSLILQMFDEGKISDFEKKLLLTAVDELKKNETEVKI
jgi:hypothetical protein